MLGQKGRARFRDANVGGCHGKLTLNVGCVDFANGVWASKKPDAHGLKIDQFCRQREMAGPPE
jgi:hypothetical protein